MRLLKVHCTFANWRKSGSILAKVRGTFANWRNSRSCIGESTVDFRQLAKFQGACWRKYSGLSPLAKVILAKILLAKFRNPDVDNQHTDMNLSLSDWTQYSRYLSKPEKLSKESSQSIYSSLSNSIIRLI